MKAADEQGPFGAEQEGEVLEPAGREGGVRSCIEAEEVGRSGEDPGWYFG